MTVVPGYLTVTEAAARLNVSRVTIWRHIRSGELTTYRTASNSRVRLLDIEDIQAIERVTQERGRTYHDWSGEDGWATHFGAWKLFDPAASADLTYSDVYAEQQWELPTVESEWARREDEALLE